MTIEDADAAFNNWTSDPEVTQFLTWPTHSTVDVTKALISSVLAEYEKPEYYNWYIVLKSTNEPIGSIGVVRDNFNVGMVHMGYCIGKAWWNKGYTSEALEVLIRFFFEQVGANRIEARHNPNNPNSGKVMQKCGMKYEGTLRQSDRCNNGICDAAYYAILAEEDSLHLPPLVN
jgi:ribosomal-protein-alanine N-acetyltransferase